jgi:hypothetical protein
MARRTYTGWDGNASGKRAGLEAFVKLTNKHFGGGVWNNGTWGVRNQKRPGGAKPSVHGTGRAADLSWRRNAEWNGKVIKRSTSGFGSHSKAVQVLEFWEANAVLFLIEEMHDYYPSPFGRGWRCNRAAWKSYQKQTIGGSPGGDWFHVEIAPEHADDAAYYRDAFAKALGNPIPPRSSSPAVGGGGAGKSGKRGTGALVAPSGRPELTRADETAVKPPVKQLQTILVAEGWAVFKKADGRYGDRTWRSVKTMQVELGFSGKKVDGRYGPSTAGKLTAYLAART